MEQTDQPADDLLTRALDEQLAEQRTLNQLLSRVDDALSTLDRRLESLEQRLGAQEEAVRSAARHTRTAEELHAEAQAALGEQARQLEELRGAVSGDVGDAAVQVEGLRGVVERLHGELEQRLDAAVARSAKAVTTAADAVLGEQVRQLEELRGLVAGDLEEASRQAGLLAELVGQARATFVEHLEAAGERVAAVAAQLETAAAEQVSSLHEATAQARDTFAGADEHSAALGQAASSLYGVEAEIRESLVGLTADLERAAERAVRAARTQSGRTLEPALRRLEELGDRLVDELSGGQSALTCRTCGFAAKSAAGLSAHRRRHR